jgi:hypothetical protein
MTPTEDFLENVKSSPPSDALKGSASVESTKRMQASLPVALCLEIGLRKEEAQVTRVLGLREWDSGTLGNFGGGPRP